MDTETVKLLGAGSAQIILAAGVVAFAAGCVWLLRALLESYDGRLADQVEMLKQQSADTRLATDALRDMKSAIDGLIAALRGKI